MTAANRTTDGPAAQSSAMPRVSIMVPTFNQADFLPDTIASCLAQDYPDIEVIIGDDASVDATAEIASRLAADRRVRVHRHDRNIGRVANYRYLLTELATGDWVINLDGDDCFLDPSFIRLAMRRAMEDPDIVMVFAKALKAATPDGPGDILNEGLAIPPVLDGIAFLERYPPFETAAPLHATCLYHRESALALDFYRCNILSTDFESLYRLMLGRKVAFLDRTVALWRQHDSNASSRQDFTHLAANFVVFEGPAARAREAGLMTEATASRWLAQRAARYLVGAGARAWRGQLAGRDTLRLASYLLRRHPRLLRELPAMIRSAAATARARSRRERPSRLP